MKNKTYKYNRKTGLCVEIDTTTPEVDAPFVEDDTIPDTVSHATDEGLVFTSRKALYAHYKTHGMECVGKESGVHTGRGVADISARQFDSPEERSRKVEWGMLKIDPEIRRQVFELQRKTKWGMAPLTEREKHSCQMEERQYQEYCKSQKL